jgi:hypothetical protein
VTFLKFFLKFMKQNTYKESNVNALRWPKLTQKETVHLSHDLYIDQSMPPTLPFKSMATGNKA